MEIEAIKRAFISSELNGANLKPVITECFVVNAVNLELIQTIYEHYHYPHTGQLLKHIVDAVTYEENESLIRDVVEAIKLSKFSVDNFTVSVVKYIVRTLGDHEFIFSETFGHTIAEQALEYDRAFVVCEIQKGLLRAKTSRKAISLLGVLSASEKL